MAEKVNKELNLKEIAKALVKEYKTQEAIFGEGGAIKQLFGRTLEACLDIMVPSIWTEKKII